jgi:hypothetical protein
VKLERGKSKDVLLALPDKNLKHTRKIGACFKNALRKDMPKMGERASTGIFAHNRVVLQKIVGKHNGQEGMLHVQLRKLRQIGWR